MVDKAVLLVLNLFLHITYFVDVQNTIYASVIISYVGDRKSVV